MSSIFNALPLAAVALGQIASGSSPSALATYGPIGIICVWLIFRDEKRATQIDNLRESIESVAHQMKGLNRNLLYQAASSGAPGIREVAAKELERITAKD